MWHALFTTIVTNKLPNILSEAVNHSSGYQLLHQCFFFFTVTQYNTQHGKNNCIGYIQQHGTYYNSMVPNKTAWHPIQQHGTQYNRMTPSTTVWHILQQHGTQYNSMSPNTTTWYPIQQRGTQYNSMVNISSTATSSPSVISLRLLLKLLSQLIMLKGN